MGSLNCSKLDVLIFSFTIFTLVAELRPWLKSLRLHKYADLVEKLSYMQLITLTDSDLLSLGRPCPDPDSRHHYL